MKKSELRKMIREELLSEASDPKKTAIDVWNKAQDAFIKKVNKAFLKKRVSLDGIGGTVFEVEHLDSEEARYHFPPLRLWVDWDYSKTKYHQPVFVDDPDLTWE